MEKVVELCATVVTAQVQGQWMTSEEISASIRAVYGTLADLNQAACQPPDGTGQTTDASNRLAAMRREPGQSFQKESVTCLECGKEFQLLSNRHLVLHGLTPREYKRKWGLPLTTSLSARTLTVRRRKLAKQMGMGTALADWREARKHVAG